VTASKKSLATSLRKSKRFPHEANLRIRLIPRAAAFLPAAQSPS
jgi:hypothetical protein